MNRESLRRLLLSAAALVPCAGLARQAVGETTMQTTPPPTAKEQVPGSSTMAPEPSNTLSINGLVGVDFVTAYVTRGVVLENQGFIAQPYAELQFKLAEDVAVFDKVSGVVGIWNSIHSEHTDEGLANGTGDGGGADAWYEFDWYVGASFDFAEKWNLTWVYQEFISPNDGFGTCDNTQLKLSFNDTGLWGNDTFALRPFGLVFVELDGKAGTGPEEGVYVEVGVEPAFAIGGTDLTLSVPIRAGFGFSDFYEEDEEFGFAAIGLKAAVPLKFMPARYGSWTAYAMVEYQYLGDGVDDFNDAGVHTDDDIVVGKAGVSFTF